MRGGLNRDIGVGAGQFLGICAGGGCELAADSSLITECARVR